MISLLWVIELAGLISSAGAAVKIRLEAVRYTHLVWVVQGKRLQDLQHIDCTITNRVDMVSQRRALGRKPAFLWKKQLSKLEITNKKVIPPTSGPFLGTFWPYSAPCSETEDKKVASCLDSECPHTGRMKVTLIKSWPSPNPDTSPLAWRDGLGLGIFLFFKVKICVLIKFLFIYQILKKWVMTTVTGNPTKAPFISQ